MASRIVREIVHALVGHDLKTLLNEKTVSKDELAIKTGFSIQFINGVLANTQDISFQQATVICHALDVSLSDLCGMVFSNVPADMLIY